jgi:hypothetical protein
MKTDVSFRGPAALHFLLATRVAGPRNLLSATAWPDAAARTKRAVATGPDRAGQRQCRAPKPATGIPTVDFSVAPRVWGNRRCGAALPRNDSARCGAEGLRFREARSLLAMRMIACRVDRRICRMSARHLRLRARTREASVGALRTQILRSAHRLLCVPDTPRRRLSQDDRWGQKALPTNDNTGVIIRSLLPPSSRTAPHTRVGHLPTSRACGSAGAQAFCAVPVLNPQFTRGKR